MRKNDEFYIYYDRLVYENFIKRSGFSTLHPKICKPKFLNEIYHFKNKESGMVTRNSKTVGTSKLVEQSINGQTTYENLNTFGCYFTNKIHIFNKKKNEFSLFELKSIEETNEKINFYYNEQTVFYVHYQIQKIFFLNVFWKNKMRNFSFDFEENNFEDGVLYSKEMEFYINDGYLEDFSLCASEQYLFLIWGLHVQKLNNISSTIKTSISPNIYAYKINEKKWLELKIDQPPENPIIPRSKISSCTIQRKQNGQFFDYIYVFGGTPYTNIGGESDLNNLYFNTIEEFKVFEEEKGKKKILKYNYFSFPKENYKGTYKPLESSISLAFPSKDFNVSELILMGGSFSPFVSNINQASLIGYSIKVNHSSNSIEFQNLSRKKFPSELKGINVILASNCINALIYQDQLIFSPLILSKEKKGIFIDLHPDDKIISKTESFYLKSNNGILSQRLLKVKTAELFQKNLNLEFKFVTKDSKINIHELFTINKRSLPTKYNYDFANFYEDSIESVENDFLLISEDRPEIVFLKLKKINDKKGKDYHLNSDDFIINYFQFSLPDIKNSKKSRYPYSDYMPSSLNITNYGKFGKKIYILVNNSKDSNFQRFVYEINMNIIDLKFSQRIDLEKVFENSLPIKGSSILVNSSSECYLLGGELVDSNKAPGIFEIDQSNVMVNLKTNEIVETLPNNVRTMISPIVTKFKDFIICIDQNFVGKDFIYGEVLNVKIKSEWIPFGISVDDCSVFGEDYLKNTLNMKDLKISITKISSLGKMLTRSSLKEVLFAEYKDKDESKRKKMIFLNLKKLVKLTNSSNNHKEDFEENEPKLVKYRTDDSYYRINDAFNDTTKVYFFDSNFNVDQWSGPKIH